MTLVYLVQHGDKERLPGDPGLTATGRQQAEMAARWLGSAGPVATLTGPAIPRFEGTSRRQDQETYQGVGVPGRLAALLL